MWASMDVDATGVKVELTKDAQQQPRIRISYGELTIRLTVTELVDLLDAGAQAIAELDASTKRDIRRDEGQIRAAADVREGL